MSNDNMFSQILQFVDENPHKKWSLEEMARHFHYSPYHFHRLFKRISGETFQQFVMRRRLSYSAQELMNSNQQVLDIALRYEYRSHEAFSRAFKNNFHITPATFRKKQAVFPFFEQNFLFPPKSKVQKPSLNFIPAFTHVGKKLAQDRAGIVWGALIKEIDVTNDQILIGIIDHHSHEYVAGIPMEGENLSSLKNVTNIPESLYVTMDHYGSYGTIIKTYEYLLNKWLPNSPYIFDENKRQIEIYEQNKLVKICIPVKELIHDETDPNKKDYFN